MGGVEQAMGISEILEFFAETVPTNHSIFSGTVPVYSWILLTMLKPKAFQISENLPKLF